jgi:hypothetical protein
VNQWLAQVLHVLALAAVLAGAPASFCVLRRTVGAAGRGLAGDDPLAGDAAADEFAAVARAGPCPDMAAIQAWAGRPQ